MTDFDLVSTVTPVLRTGDRRSTRAERRVLRREGSRLERASWAFSTRRVPSEAAQLLLPPEGRPNPGDLVLCRVDALGHHSGLQLPSGRRRSMFAGDEIVVAYGNRYASSQFEAIVPDSFGPCHLVAGGGIASRALNWHAKISKGPTHVTPMAVLGDAEGRRLNLKRFAVPQIDRVEGQQPPTIAVVGTGMDSGKTQSAAYFVRGLKQAGLRVGYAKVTGTGAGGDTWLLTDAGANPVLDFTDAGHATTYMASPEEVAIILTSLIAHQAQAGVDAIVLEIADGVYQRETSTLLRSPTFARHVHGVILAACDSMGASAGVHWLRDARAPVLAVSGIISAAPLQAREAREALGLDVLNREELANGENAVRILSSSSHSSAATALRTMPSAQAARQ